MKGGLTYGGFICSDEPVVVAPTDPAAPHDRVWKMDDLNTDVTIPLDRDLALLGRSEPQEGDFKVNAVDVAAVNTRTFANNKHMVYAARPDFLLLRANNDPVRASVAVKQGLLTMLG